MYDLLVIGGGSGGVTVATAATRLGAKVGLIERGSLGGECSHTACVPSKALLRAGRAAHDTRNAGRFGVRVEGVTVDFARVMARVRDTVAGFAPPDAADQIRAKGIDVHFGSPSFEAYDTVVLDGRERLSASKFVIATGSRPAVPEIPGLIEAGFLTNRTIWTLEALPESLLILGGGPVGLEFGQAFARLGTQVTILDENPEILHREEPECARVLRQFLTAEGITFFTNVEVTGMGVKDGKTLVKFRSKRDGSTFEALRSHVLVATGRVANVEGLNLEAVGIHASAEHGIPVDEYLATASRHIYAIGDVTGRDQFTHAADREAVVVAHNITSTIPKKFRDDAMPRTIFTDPEFAAVGLTEAQAREIEPESLVSSLDLATLDRVRIDGNPGGLAKLISSPSGKVLGATIVGPESSLVLQEFVLAIEHGLTLADLASTIQPYPTVSAAVRSLAVQGTGGKREGGALKSALKWFSNS
jgi:pyruvate/2-oxoglutarate dehydrogenase complex dihydrolipoamide dehydrogenase (E3) component